MVIIGDNTYTRPRYTRRGGGGVGGREALSEEDRREGSRGKSDEVRVEEDEVKMER